MLIRQCITLLIFALAVSGCGDKTAGESLSFDTAALGVVDSKALVTTFTNRKGWKITLTKAALAIGPVYYYSSEAQAGIIEKIFSFQKAYACPAHAQFDKGTVLGEIRKQVVVDLISDSPTLTGTSHGEQGQCKMFEIHFHPPGELPAFSDETKFKLLDGHSFHISGTAEKNGKPIVFSGNMTIPDTGTMRIVESITANIELDGRAGRAVTMIHVDKQLSNIDFESLVDSSGACLEYADKDICGFPEDSQAFIAWLSGVRSRESYSLEWQN